MNSQVFTGLTPGVHVNLVAAVIIGVGFGSEALPALIALAVTHTFLDTIPAIYLGAPDSATALGVLPGHRYLLKGIGYMAIKLTLVGSLCGIVVALLLTPLWLAIIPHYTLIMPFMGWILLAISAYMITRDRKPGWSLLVYVLAGVLGLLLLRREIVVEPLFPLLSGLFGTSTLLYSLTQTQTLPEQRFSTDIALKKGPAIKGLLAGNVSGFLTSMLPGLGAAQAAVIGMKLAPKVGDHGFLLMLGTISTVNFTLSLYTWMLLDKARNGIVIAAKHIVPVSVDVIVFLIGVALVAAACATPLCLFLGRGFAKNSEHITVQALDTGVIGLLIGLVAWRTGMMGLFVLAVSTAVGLVPAIVRCSRAHGMGCIMAPVTVFFLTL